jgi:hypothetical protein
MVYHFRRENNHSRRKVITELPKQELENIYSEVWRGKWKPVTDDGNRQRRADDGEQSVGR